MAASQSKRSVYPVQPAHRTSTSKLVRFPQAKGKILEAVEFANTSDYHAVALNFQDKTCLIFMIDPCFTLEVEYVDRKSGEERVLKQWPPSRSQRFRIP